MPLTPYHFGPSGFAGLVLRKWIDVPVFVLANIVIDLEVLTIMIFRLGWPYHRYFHTLLFGALVGVAWGAAAYPLRHVFGSMMRSLGLSYDTTLRRMVISGVLGTSLHVLIDGIYHRDVHVFWPNTTVSFRELMRQHISRGQIRIVCVALLIATVLYFIAARESPKNPPKSRRRGE